MDDTRGGNTAAFVERTYSPYVVASSLPFARGLPADSLDSEWDPLPPWVDATREPGLAVEEWLRGGPTEAAAAKDDAERLVWEEAYCSGRSVEEETGGTFGASVGCGSTSGGGRYVVLKDDGGGGGGGRGFDLDENCERARGWTVGQRLV